jgi:hypothetical protein
MVTAAPKRQRRRRNTTGIALLALDMYIRRVNGFISQSEPDSAHVSAVGVVTSTHKRAQRRPCSAREQENSRADGATLPRRVRKAAATTPSTVCRHGDAHRKLTLTSGERSRLLLDDCSFYHKAHNGVTACIRASTNGRQRPARSPTLGAAWNTHCVASRLPSCAAVFDETRPADALATHTCTLAHCRL